VNAKQRKSAAELAAMILTEINDPRLMVAVSTYPAKGWHATISAWGNVGVAGIMRAQQIAERFRMQYDLREPY
jgi:hypothetical protein